MSDVGSYTEQMRWMPTCWLPWYLDQPQHEGHCWLLTRTITEERTWQLGNLAHGSLNPRTVRHGDLKIGLVKINVFDEDVIELLHFVLRVSR